jgi:hypothetical protein
MHEHFQRGERAALGAVDDRDARSVPAARVLRGAATVERTGEARLLADAPSRDQAKIPCSSLWGKQALG